MKTSYLVGVEWEVIHWSDKELSIHDTILKDDLGLAVAHGRCVQNISLRSLVWLKEFATKRNGLT